MEKGPLLEEVSMVGRTCSGTEKVGARLEDVVQPLTHYSDEVRVGRDEPT
jgi:hypothetical protein